MCCKIVESESPVATKIALLLDSLFESDRYTLTLDFDYDLGSSTTLNRVYLVKKTTILCTLYIIALELYYPAYNNSRTGRLLRKFN